MAGTDNVAGDSSLSTEGLMAGQQIQSGDLAEWRSCDQIENGTPSTSPPFWDTDEDDSGPKPSELFGKFTWKIESFSSINKRELRSNAFEVGGYKWYILIYPQGCDVCNHLSLFLCVANHEKLLPGWSHFAQFTIAVVNKDPKKSKYSDTLHRFWKKEHDWGWKKFMELSKVVDGFIVSDTLVIKAQVQVIREKTDRPFRCLDCQYRRELVRVYLSNVEQICRRFVEERRGKLCKLIEDRVRWSSFRLFWLGINENARLHMSRDKKDAILKVVVKHFFIEKEVTSTLVMDSLYSGLKALEWQSEKREGTNSSIETDEMPTPIVYVEDDMFVLADDVLGLVERTALEPLPLKDEKVVQSQSQNQNRTKEGSSSEEFSKDSIERDERRLTELGRRTVELFVLAHIFSSRIEVAYQEVVALKRQEELIREEEAAEQAEIELRAKRSAAEKEKRAKKKQAKQKRNNRKGKDVARDENPDNKPRKGTAVDDIVINLAEKLEETVEQVETLDGSDGDVGGAALDDREASPRNWDTDVSEVIPGTDASSSEIQNDQHEKKNSSIVDDSSSTCSTDSVPSVVANGAYKVNTLSNNKCHSSSSRGRNRRNRSMRAHKSQAYYDTESLASEAVTATGLSHDASTNRAHEIVGSVSSKDGMQMHEEVLNQKQDASLQNMQPVRDQILETPFKSSEPESSSAMQSMRPASDQILEAPFKSTGPESSSTMQSVQSAKDQILETPSKSRESSSTMQSVQPARDQIPETPSKSREPESSYSATCSEGLCPKEPKQTNGKTSTTPVESTLKRELATERPTEKLDCTPSKSLLMASPSKQEAQKFAAINKVTSLNDASPVSRPLSAPLSPAPRPNVTLVSTSQAVPLLSRSTSAIGRIGVTDSPASSQSYIPQSYRNVMLGTNNFAGGSTNFVHQPCSSSSSQARLYSQPPVSLVTPSNSTASFQGRMDQTRQTTARTGFNFGSVNPKVLNSGSFQVADSSLQVSTSGAYHASNLIDQTAKLSVREASSSNIHSETAAGASTRQIQVGATDEFPHLDIINYLLEEEHSDGKTAGAGYNQFGLNRQYTFPGSFSLASESSNTNSSGRFDGPDHYFFDTSQGMYGSPVQPFDGKDSSVYASSDLDGMIMTQWPSSSADSSHIGVNAPGHRNGYPYQFQDYSNLTCGVNGFSMYRPANGY